MHFLLSGGFDLFSDIETCAKPAMVLKLGKFPLRWWEKWSGRAKWFDEDGNWLGNEDMRSSLRFGEWMKPGPGGPDKLEEEAEMDRARVEKILRRMVDYDPAKRPTAQEVAELIPDSWIKNHPGIEWHGDDFGVGY